MIWNCCYVCLLYIFQISLYFSVDFVCFMWQHMILFMFYFFSHDQVVTLQVFIYCFWRMPEHLLSCILLSIVIWNYLKSQWLKTRCIYFLTASVGQWQLRVSVSGVHTRLQSSRDSTQEVSSFTEVMVDRPQVSSSFLTRFSSLPPLSLYNSIKLPTTVQFASPRVSRGREGKKDKETGWEVGEAKGKR